VIKVEPPGGDPMRAYPSLFARLNVNKRSIVLDLKEDHDRVTARELMAEADVMVEGYRPGVAARLGVGYDDARACNPAIVYCSLSGLGQTGPLAHASGHDLNYQAWAGALAPEGGEPRWAAIPVADLAGGLAAAFAICAAVVRGNRTGEGEYIDAAMADVLATWTGVEEPEAAGVDAEAREVPGYGMFATRDGAHVVLGVLTEDHFWAPLCDALSLGDARALSFTERMAQSAMLQPRVRDAIAQYERDELVARLLAVNVPVAPVLDRAAMSTLDHFVGRDVVTSVPWLGTATGFAVRFVNHPAAIATPAPAIDEHRGARFRAR